MRVHRSTALLAGLFVCVSATALLAQDQSKKTSQSKLAPAGSPAIALTITTPDGQSKELTTHESGLVTVETAGHEYGFRPTMHDDAGKRMTVTIFDMGSGTEAAHEVGTVEVQGEGQAVSSKTSPAFKVRARKGTANPNT